MKKVVAILLACCMFISVFAASANAETKSGNPDAALGAVADKLDQSVIKCLYNPTGEGNYFEIQYHGASQSELLALIGAICDYELVNVDIGEGKVAVGLPYSYLTRVAGLDSVDYISLFTLTYNSKITQSLQVKLDQVNYGDKTAVGVFLYCTYDEAEIFRQAIKECGYVGGLPLNMTLEEVYAYKAVYNRLVSEQEAVVASSFVEKLGIADEDIIYLGKHSYVFANLTKAQIINAAQMNEVESIYKYEDSPIEAPTEAPTIAPTEAPTEANDDFLGYPVDHWTNNALIFCNTDGIFTSATVCYIDEGSGVWKSAQMTYGGKNEYGESFWYFTMPSKKCRYYITDGTHRTREEYFNGEIILYLEKTQDNNGYYDLSLDWYSAIEPSYLYRERLKEYYNLCEYDEDPYMGLMGYQELYYHRDSNGDIDWALIQCYSGLESPIELLAIVGNRVLHPGRDLHPFSTTYGIYDVKNDKFIDACTSGSTLSEAYNYDGFVRAFDEIVGGGMGWSMADVDNQGKGKPLGDLDNDNKLTIVDVTMIQRCVALMTDYPATDAFAVTYDFRRTHYYSDFNLDGERDILDATCIQRYLVGMDYPIG